MTRGHHRQSTKRSKYVTVLYLQWLVEPKSTASDWMRTGQVIWNQFECILRKYFAAHRFTSMHAFTVRNIIIYWRAVIVAAIARAHFVSTQKYQFSQKMNCSRKKIATVNCIFAHRNAHENSQIDLACAACAARYSHIKRDQITTQTSDARKQTHTVTAHRQTQIHTSTGGEVLLMLPPFGLLIHRITLAIGDHSNHSSSSLNM